MPQDCLNAFGKKEEVVGKAEEAQKIV